MRRTTTTTNKVSVRKYDSIAAFVADVDTRPVNNIFKYSRQGSTDGSEYFTKTSDYPTAHNLLTNGDNETAKKIQSHFVRLNQLATTTRPKTRPFFVGGAPIVGAYLSGDPNCMLAKRPTATRARVLNLVYNCAVCGSVDADELAKAGAALLTAINTIEKNDVRINLYCAVCSEKNNEKICFAVRVKTDGQPLNLMQIAYPVAHPSFLRRHYFKVVETDPVIRSKKWVDSYGYVVEGAEAKQVITDAGIKYDAYLDFDSSGYGIRYDKPDQIVKRILTALKH